MGWDAHAFGEGMEFDEKGEKLKDERLREAFATASRTVVTAVGSVDGFLEMGGLDCSKCARYLQQATNMNVMLPVDYDPADVAELAARANWSIPIAAGEVVYYLSAKLFLETCADNGLGITFTM